VPSKALIRSAKILSYAGRAREFGFQEGSISYDFAEVMERVQAIIRKVEPHDSVERYTALGVECIQGAARLVSPWEISVNGRSITARSIIVATGGRPFIPPIEGLDQIDYYTSDTIWEMRQRPQKMVVLGGGPIGCELSQAFNRLGIDITQVQLGDYLMPREDTEISELVADRFRAEGIKVLTGHRATRITRDDAGQALICEAGEKELSIPFDALLIAVGRTANVKGFGLEELGVDVSAQGTLAADGFLRTNFPNIFCSGDVAGPYQFTHTAAHQSWYAAVNALFGRLKKFRVDYRVIPWSTFTDPEVARVGLNELEAREKKIDYEVTRYGIDDLDRAIADSEDHGVVKVLTAPGSDKILGVTIVGPHASDIIAEYVLAMKHGLGLNKIMGTIHIYPTLAEANKFAAGEWKKAHAPERLLKWVAKYHNWMRR
jgi:pyruvate/2-oxoglutarate dehydrogenase complex dihydrolipoamide dehydrogenase (E3) component